MYDPVERRSRERRFMQDGPGVGIYSPNILVPVKNELVE